MATVDREITLKEVGEHNSKKDAWMTAGTDASEAFDNARHSEDANEIMAAYRIGKFKGASNTRSAAKPVRLTPRPVPTQSSSSTKQGVCISSSSLAVGTVIVTLGALGVYYVSGRADNLTPLSLPKLSNALSIGLPRWFIFNASSSSSGGRQESNFAEGFVVASVMSSIVGGVATKKLSQLLRVETGFKYPTHIKMPKLVEPEPLLARGWPSDVTGWITASPL